MRVARAEDAEILSIEKKKLKTQQEILSTLKSILQIMKEERDSRCSTPPILSPSLLQAIRPILVQYQNDQDN